MFSALDFTLAWRMLVRYPGLSLVSVFGMAVGITIAAGAFTIVSLMMDTKLPLPESERLVSLLSWDVATTNRETRNLFDLEAWRGAEVHRRLQRVAHRRTQPVVDGRPPEIVTVAEMSASAFGAARIDAFSGRTCCRKTSAPAPPTPSSSATTNGSAASAPIRTSSAAS